MWSERQSQLLLIRVSKGGLRRLVIPVPLFVLDLTLAAFSDLVYVLDSLAPKWMCGLRRFEFGGAGTGRISAELMFAVCLQMFREMRKYGRLRLVEVQSGRTRVFIDLY